MGSLWSADNRGKVIRLSGSKLKQSLAALLAADVAGKQAQP